MSWCSKIDQFTDGNRDSICGAHKPKYRSCHISAINDEELESSFKFTSHKYFTADSAYTVCEKIGGFVPNLEEELDAVWLQQTMEYLTSYVEIGWPFSFRWMTWPVSDKLMFVNNFGPNIVTNLKHLVSSMFATFIIFRNFCSLYFWMGNVSIGFLHRQYRIRITSKYKIVQ